MAEEGIQKLTRDQCTKQLKDTLKTNEHRLSMA